MSTILTAEFDTNEEDIDYKSENEQESQNSLEENSQESIENEEAPSIDVDQVPVGKVEFELTERKKCTGEALLYPGSDEKVTTINELECEDTIDEEDCTFNIENEEINEEDSQEDCDEEMGEGENEENDEEKGEEEASDIDDEDLKNYEVVTKPGTEICKMKFKDVEAWKSENCQKEEETSNMEEDCSQEGEEEAEKSPEEPNLSKICENYNEEADEDYNPIYNEDTLSDIECEEDQDREDDEDLKKPEVVYTNDEFCMIKQDEVPVLQSIVKDSREEMECC